MGQTLGEPITKKETASCTDSNYKVGSSCMQGWRINMEDAHTHLLSLPDDSRSAFFAVYDGHGGEKVSQYASMHLHKRITGDSAYHQGDIEKALKNGFLNLDSQMLDDKDMKEEMSGTTATTVLIKDSTIYCANVGDSRAVASVNGAPIALSNDHKPRNEEESARIAAAGGWVEFNRVNGNLALSRALGDFVFKQNDHLPAEEQIVTANPEILKFPITPDFEFIVLACDGIWDVMSNWEVVSFCREGFLKGKTPEQICEELLDKCLAPDCELTGIGCDNMTVVLVALLCGDTFEAFITRLEKAPKVDPSLYMTKEQEEEANNVADNSEVSTVVVATTEESTVVDDLFCTPSGSPNPGVPCQNASALNFEVPSPLTSEDLPSMELDNSADKPASK